MASSRNTAIDDPEAVRLWDFEPGRKVSCGQESTLMSSSTRGSMVSIGCDDTTIMVVARSEDPPTYGDPSPSPYTIPERARSGPPVGAIVGAVLGGLVLLVALCICIYALRKRRARSHAYGKLAGSDKHKEKDAAEAPVITPFRDPCLLGIQPVSMDQLRTPPPSSPVLPLDSINRAFAASVLESGTSSVLESTSSVSVDTGPAAVNVVDGPRHAGYELHMSPPSSVRVPSRHASVGVVAPYPSPPPRFQNPMSATGVGSAPGSRDEIGQRGLAGERLD